MNYKTAIRTCFNDKFCDFSGRASRSEFWFFHLFAVIAIFVTVFLSLVISAMVGSDAARVILGLISLLGIIFLLAFLIPLLAVTARRLHDVNLSGWWQALPFLFSIVESISGTPIDALMSASFSVFSSIIIIFYVKQGNEGSNRFGDSPFAGEFEEREMDFQTSVRTCLKDKYFNFKGRASRAEFWLLLLFMCVIQTLILAVATLFDAPLFFLIGMGILFVLTTIPYFAVMARRLHDRNHSGWWALLPIVIPVCAWILLLSSETYEDLRLRTVLSAVLTCIVGIPFFVTLMRKGTEDRNRFDLPTFEEMQHRL